MEESASFEFNLGSDDAVDDLLCQVSVKIGFSGVDWTGAFRLGVAKNTYECVVYVHPEDV